ncbi:hypothetical protein [Glaciimonas sp. GG7]
MAINENMPRTAQGKVVLPIVFPGTYQEFSKTFSEYRSCEMNSELSGESFEKVVARNQAIVQLRAISLADLDGTKLENIYVSGHGLDGYSAILSVSSTGITVEKTADQLVADLNDFLLKHKQKIELRLTSCHSADRESINSFEPLAIAENARSYGGLKPFAQHVANALDLAELNHVDAIGYPGLGVNTTTNDFHRARVLEKDSEPLDYGSLQRASCVKRKFVAETSGKIVPKKIYPIPQPRKSKTTTTG